MEAQNIIAYEYKKEERVYRLELPHGAPLGEAYEASASFLAEVVRLINEHAEKVKPLEEEKAAEAEADSESQE